MIASSTADFGRHPYFSTELVSGREWIGLVGVIALHVALLAAAVASGFGKPDPAVIPPAMVGVLVPSDPGEIAPKPPQPKPAVQPEAKQTVARKPTVQPAKAPPTDRSPVVVRNDSEVTVKDTKPASSEPPAVADKSVAAPPAPAPVIPPRTDASHLNNPAPVYPPIARRMGEQGQVLLDVHILPDGSVGEVKLKRSSGFSRLDESAMQAVRRWRYVPARRGSEPIAYWYVQPVNFTLDN